MRAGMGRWTWRLVSLGLFSGLSQSSGGCGDGGDKGPEMCGEAVCGLHQSCDESQAPAVCICDDAYVGVDCDECAPGYVPEGERCVPTPIDCSQDPCGASGTCVEGPNGDRCECDADHAGPTCAQCRDETLQDNDRDGTCTPACSAAAGCAPWEACDDSSGIITCGCAAHTTGRHCDECESGYYRLADGPCVAACSYRLECEEPRTCKEVEGVDAACSCPLGFTGEACDACAAGFSMEDGACVRAPRPGSFLVTRKDMNWSVLNELDLASETYTPLSSQVPYLLSVDRGARELWGGVHEGSDGVRFGRYTLSTGEVEALSPSSPFDASTVFDPSRRAVFWVVPNTATYQSGQLMRLDVDTGVEAPVGSEIPIRSGDFLAYDAKEDRLVGTGWDMGLVLVEIDPETGVLTEIGKPVLDSNLTNPRLAVDDEGFIYLSTTLLRPQEQVVREMLQAVSVRLGMPSIPDDAPVVLEHRYWADPSMPVTLASSKQSGSEVLAYDSHGDFQDSGVPEPTSLSVDVHNPDALLSVTSLNESFQVHVPADASFKSLLIYTGGTVALDIEQGFQGEPGTIRIIADISQDALEALSPAVRTYSGAAVDSRRAPLDAYFDEMDHSPPAWLVRVDPDTLAATPLLRLEESGSVLALF